MKKTWKLISFIVAVLFVSWLFTVPAVAAPRSSVSFAPVTCTFSASANDDVTVNLARASTITITLANEGTLYNKALRAGRTVIPLGFPGGGTFVTTVRANGVLLATHTLNSMPCIPQVTISDVNCSPREVTVNALVGSNFAVTTLFVVVNGTVVSYPNVYTGNNSFTVPIPVTANPVPVEILGVGRPLAYRVVTANCVPVIVPPVATTQLVTVDQTNSDEGEHYTYHHRHHHHDYNDNEDED
jgi:hypothetical protein